MRAPLRTALRMPPCSLLFPEALKGFKCSSLSILNSCKISQFGHGPEARRSYLHFSSSHQPSLKQRLPLSIPVGEGARVRRRYLAQHVVHDRSCGPTWIVPSNRNTPPCVTNTTNPSDIWANHSYGSTVDCAEPEELVINTVTFLKLAI